MLNIKPEPFDKKIAIANAMNYQNKHYKLLEKCISNLMLRINKEIQSASLKGNRYCKITIDNNIDNLTTKTENILNNKVLTDSGELDTIVDAITQIYTRNGYCVRVSSNNHQYRSVDIKNNFICTVCICIEW